MIPLKPTLVQAKGHPSGKPFYYVAVARKVSYHDMLQLKPGDVWASIRSEVQRFADVHGLVIVGDWESMVADAPGHDLLSLDKWVATRVQVDYKEPTPGYDADGQEVWEDEK